MAAAFELTRPEHNGKYNVTVYQLGWRLGGKGASGRGPADRIEEHGLHLWMGFYENAFRLMRECYADAKRDPNTCRIAHWHDAFHPDNLNAVADRSPGGTWLPWKVNFPPLPGLPGDPVQRPRPWTVADYVARSLMLIQTLLESIQLRVGAIPSPTTQPRTTTPTDVTEGISRLLRFGQLATFGGLIEGLRLMQVAVVAFSQYPGSLILRFYEAIAAEARSQLESLIARDDELRRLWEIVDITLAVVRGAIQFRLMTDPRGFDALDEYECREWLCLNGASRASVNSAATRSLYDLAFAYEDGDVRRPRIAAGAALRGSFRAFFTYRGAFFWKMQSGMGDVVFAPLWEVLKKRGVRFEFFHRLQNVRIADGAPGDRPYVDELEFDVQADTIGGEEYRPLVDVRGLPCWPSEPDWSQLVDGRGLKDEGRDFESHWDRRHTEKKTLRVGGDFDFVVLGVGIGAIPHVCRELVARDPRWQAMVEHVKTVPTQALQVWMSEDMKALGWNDGPVNISGFVEPFDTWADMTHLASEESHRDDVRAIGYFCSVLPDAPGEQTARPSYPNERRAEVKENAIRFLNQDIVHLWPRAARPEGFRWEILIDSSATAKAASAEGQARFDGQYWRANVNPSDRYALSLPGSLRYRISPLDHTYENLTITGDWTECGLNQGCVEAAVMSGMLAAHAISKSPPLEEIAGYDQP
jgi:uncharacterized protein with NAD-binding domain and iron-sulfur cluster